MAPPTHELSARGFDVFSKARQSKGLERVINE